ncbi:MAG TPA: hypothetical protein VM819_17530 [Vicinamibacterales bacterium]|nr:hypothetical protein [Vicinamibacterales bacterium]
MTVACVAIWTALALVQAPANVGALPPEVQKAFEQAYPRATISATVPQREGNRTLFRIDSVDGGRRRVVLFDARGAVVEVAEPVEERELPKPVLAAIRSHRRAIYVSGMKVTRGRNVEYRITVKGSRRTAMVARPDGTVVSFE